uniref:Protein LMBR1L n=1 Tax=Strigamia maritima TaxID=126957 RepID=T1J7X6_STRMM
MDDETDFREQIFHNTVREYIIFLLLFTMLYVISYATISTFKRKDKEECYGDDEDAVVNRISLWMCTFSMAISIGAALLLPISIISNEVLLLYPKSYYVQWLNSSLIHGLWNHIFLFSNVSLFLLLPFAYLFTEAEGFSGSRKGIMARVYETFVVLTLLFLAVLGMTYILSALIDQGRSSLDSLFMFFLSLAIKFIFNSEFTQAPSLLENKWKIIYDFIFPDVWSYYLPFLYSCMSFLGALMLLCKLRIITLSISILLTKSCALVCTPLGFTKLFTVTGQLLVKPKFHGNTEELYYVKKFEEDNLRRKLVNATKSVIFSNSNLLFTEYWASFQNGKNDLEVKLAQVEAERKILETQGKASSLQSYVIYPLVTIVLLLLSIITFCVVLQNTLQLLIGFKALPISTQQFSLGITSLSSLGPYGAALEIVLILYLIVTSGVGFYTLPYFSKMQPKRHKTSMIYVISNCAVLLILNSAVPLLSRTLGITNFDLLGDFGRIEWLGNFFIVLSYNVTFIIVLALSLFVKLTTPLRRTLIRMKNRTISDTKDD